jgi:glycosyltransferase involved in cell wall biosynthesis
LIRVCHIVNLITGQADGVYAHLKMIFRNYDRNKFEHYLLFQGGEKIENEAKEFGVKTFVSSSLIKKVSIKIFVDIYSLMKVNKIDIIHVHLIKPYAIAGLVNIFLRKKFIFNYHGIFLRDNPYYNFIERNIYAAIHYLIFLFGKVDSVLVPSIRSKELLIEETNLFPEPIVYYNGYTSNQSELESNDYIIRRIQEIKRDRMIIVLIGRLEIDKRIDRAINIMNNLVAQEKNIQLFIFGDGSLKSEMQNLVNELQLNEVIEFLGYVKELQICYKFFDILLFTSDWEGMPLTMWEAMANSVPIVAPDVGGFKEILEENYCGLVYKQGNLIEAEAKLLQLLDDTESRNKLGQNGRLAVENKYTEKNFIVQIEKAYSELINK